MNRYKYIILAALTLTSCNEWQENKQQAEGKDNFQSACENSGGTYDNEKMSCKCGNTLCEQGVGCVRSQEQNENDLVCAGSSAGLYLNCVDGETKCYNGKVYVCKDSVMTFDRKCPTECKDNVCIDECETPDTAQCGTKHAANDNPNSRYKCIKREIGNGKTVKELKLIETCNNGCFESEANESNKNICEDNYKLAETESLKSYLRTLAQIRTTRCQDDTCKPAYESCLANRLDWCDFTYGIECKYYMNPEPSIPEYGINVKTCGDLLSELNTSCNANCLLTSDIEAVRKCCEPKQVNDRLSRCKEFNRECDKKLDECKQIEFHEKDSDSVYKECIEKRDECHQTCTSNNIDSIYNEAEQSCLIYDSCVNECSNDSESCKNNCNQKVESCKMECRDACKTECKDCEGDCPDNKACNTCRITYQTQECEASCDDEIFSSCEFECKNNENNCKSDCLKQQQNCIIEKAVSKLNTKIDSEDLQLKHTDCLSSENYSDCRVQCANSDKDCLDQKAKCLQEQSACRTYRLDRMNNVRKREVCAEGAYCGDCTPSQKANDLVCMMNNPDNAGVQYQCDNHGTWVKAENLCSQQASCLGNSDSMNFSEVQDVCGECINGESICENVDKVGAIYVCVNGKYEIDSTCPDNHSCQFTATYNSDAKDRRNWQCGKCKNDDITTIHLSHGASAQNALHDAIVDLYAGIYTTPECEQIARDSTADCIDKPSSTEEKCIKFRDCKDKHFVRCTPDSDIDKCVTDNYKTACEMRMYNQYYNKCLAAAAQYKDDIDEAWENDSQFIRSVCQEYSGINELREECKTKYQNEACDFFISMQDGITRESCLKNNLEQACTGGYTYKELCWNHHNQEACADYAESMKTCEVQSGAYDFPITCTDGRYPVDINEE